MLAAQLIDRKPSWGFFEDACNLAFRKPTSFHRDLLLKREWGVASPICLYLEMALSKGNRTKGHAVSYVLRVIEHLEETI
jgi:hypothetical protein